MSDTPFNPATGVWSDAKKGVRLTLDTRTRPGMVLATIEADLSKHSGHSAEFCILAEVAVHDKRAVNDEKVLYRQKVVLRQRVTELAIPTEAFRDCFTYQGKMIDVRLHGRVKVDDGVLWDTALQGALAHELLRRPAVDDDAKSIVDPKDCFCLARNFAAIPLPNKINTLGLGLVALVIMAVNTLVGWHDQMAPDGQAYFYSHRDSDGDAQSPLVNSLMLSGGAGAAVWFAMRNQLRKYMRFEFARRPGRISRATVVRMNELVRGRAHVDLRNVVVRVVACNLEKGEYKRGSGSNERTVSFSEPSRALVLFHKRIALIRKQTPVEQYLCDEFCFAPMFDVLYPPNAVSDTHGLYVHWEVQLLHDTFVDHELVAETTGLAVDEFYTAGAEATAAS
ncbi:hypothetical protein Pla175_30650 [Pirellulimonas nuda]|uniref:Uncharacterized protein n=1 Tax=Pirellulimonas nuda TaxID=2528009 RepID=A0A518DDW5_9BACT|nr:hypothetical protein [Pirellulimonas nuda]QDU89671.1 hypothetical protein Pla175_30650 [Pirellulimonas nuda]